MIAKDFGIGEATVRWHLMNRSPSTGMLLSGERRHAIFSNNGSSAGGTRTFIVEKKLHESETTPAPGSTDAWAELRNLATEVQKLTDDRANMIMRMKQLIDNEGLAEVR